MSSENRNPGYLARPAVATESMNGILNLDKPQGMTSHDVVARIRQRAGVRRAGHAGTLDPMATGVLLVCLGRATRLVEYLMAGRKTYRAVVRFGTTTDSYDAEGRVLATAPVDLARDRVRAALEAFRGKISQVPPAFSALKRDGQPLYKLARRGVEVERPAREVEIDDLVLESWDSPDLVLTIICSPGTYIRSLAADLGEKLGPGAHLAALERTASGSFRLKDAVSLPAVETATRDGRLGEMLMPMNAALADFPGTTLSPDEVQDISCGRSLHREIEVMRPEALCCAYDAAGELVALLRYDAAARRWRPHKVFVDPSKRSSERAEIER